MKNTLMAAAVLAGCNHPVDYQDEESLDPVVKGEVAVLSANFMKSCTLMLELEKQNYPFLAAISSDDLRFYRNEVFKLLESQGCEPDVTMTCNQLHYPAVDLRI